MTGRRLSDTRDEEPLEGRLLRELSRRTGSRDLRYRLPPTEITTGAETWIHAFELDGAPEALRGPLILRRFSRRAKRHPRPATRERVLHEVLHAQGFPVPRIRLADDDCPVLDGPFVVVDRLPGRVLLEEVTRLGTLGRSPLWLARSLPRILWTATRRLPRLLGGLHAELHALDAQALLDAYADAGLDRGELRVAGRMQELASRIEASGLDGLQNTLHWLGEHRPPEPTALAICHGDFQFLNVLVDGSRTSGVVDWSHAMVGDPAVDLGNTEAVLSIPVTGLPEGVRRAIVWAQRRLVARLRREYARHRPLPAASSMRFYRALRYFQELVAVGEGRLQGHRVDTLDLRQIGGKSPWLQPAITAACIADVQALTGQGLSLPPT